MKPTRPQPKTAAHRPSRVIRRPAPRKGAQIPESMEISPISGLAVVSAVSGAKPLTTENVKAMLAEFP